MYHTPLFLYVYRTALLLHPAHRQRMHLATRCRVHASRHHFRRDHRVVRNGVGAGAGGPDRFSEAE